MEVLKTIIIFLFGKKQARTHVLYFFNNVSSVAPQDAGFERRTVATTGRQLRTLFSVLYRIISKRRYILAAQLLLREKSGT